MQQGWYRNAVFYTIDVSRFYDSDENGIGDLSGVTEKLDYIQSLGVTCIWLSSLFPGMLRKGGHGATDFKDVESSLGTLGDFRKLIDEAHRRELYVMLDIDLTHTSNAHPWYTAAVKNSDSPYYDYYVWPHDEKPVLNLTNDAVWYEIETIIDFWTELGVDAFHLRTGVHSFDTGSMPGDTIAATHIENLRTSIAKRYPDLVLVGDADMEVSRLQVRLKNKPQYHAMRNSALMSSIYLALARQETTPIADILHRLNDLATPAHWINGLRDLDALHLKSLTKNERQEVCAEFAPETVMRTDDFGIRLALPTMFDDARRLRVAYSLLFALPGAPMLTYGSEIGMAENLAVAGSAVRIPMQWSDDKYGGFSESNTKVGVLKYSKRDGPFGYKKVNVAIEEANPESLLHMFRALIQMRTEHPAIGCEKVIIMENKNSSVIVLRYSTIIAIHNISDTPQSFEVAVPDDAITVYGEDYMKTRSLGPFEYCWLALPDEDAV